MQQQISTRGVNDIVDLIAEHTANGFVQQASRFRSIYQAGMLLQSQNFVVLKQRHVCHLRQAQQTRSDPIVNVMRVVSNGIGQVTKLRFQTRLCAV